MKSKSSRECISDIQVAEGVLGCLSVHIGKIGDPARGQSYETGSDGQPAELGLSWGRLGADSGLTWGRLGADLGPTWSRLWVALGLTLGRPGADLGLTLGQLLADFGRSVDLRLTLG